MVEVILKVIEAAGKPLKAGEVADFAGLDKKNVDQSIKILIKSDKIYSPKRCYYSIK